MRNTTYNSNIIKDASFAFDWADMVRIIDLAQTRSRRDYALFITMAFSGRRISEILGNPKNKNPITGLRVCDIDMSHHTINWCIEKKFLDKAHTQRKYKIVEENTFMMNELRAYAASLPIHDEERIFPLTSQRVGQLIKKYCQDLNITKTKRLCHAFRHGFSIETVKHSRCLNDLLALNQKLDHSTIDQTMDYLRFGPSNIRRISNRLKLRAIK